ncbi:MAG: 2-oxoacid:acceptor oxidoreductase subunit alpha [Anaerolineae bacterium]|nr:2-oxoacid:acceptor oxidoreductase subunit alpha [Anaerolineae bacterium]
MEWNLAKGVTIGIGGAAGDGLDKTGDTLARTAARLGLYVYAFNSYQSIIRGGHIWLQIRLSEQKAHNHGDRPHALLALNDDSLERHARAVEPGGVIFFNSDKVNCDPSLLREGVQCLGLPISELLKPFGRLPAVMQNSVMLGALLHWLNLDFQVTQEVLIDTFRHKGQQVIDQNVGVAQAGYDYARQNFEPSALAWRFSHIRRPFVTGNEAVGMGAVAAGMKFYAAYPMSPASSLLHWLVARSEKLGVAIKQAEDELAVVNMAIGAGLAGARAMCGTSGGGFALMTEAVGMAGIMETPVVILNVQRGGPSTGLPTRTEQGDLNQAFGASQGDFPRIIMAAATVTDAFYTAAEAHNLAEEFQVPVIILSDLMLGEHPETIEPDALRADVPINRGKLLAEAPPGYKRFALTLDHISPRILPGTPEGMFVAASDDHDEEGVLISDEFTNEAVRRKMQEKRMAKLEAILQRLTPPQLEGPTEAEVTLVGWGSTWGAIHEAVEQLAEVGITANHLHIKYLFPFQTEAVTAILAKSRRVIVVEINGSGQFARHLRAETGLTADATILKYVGEPFTPGYITRAVQDILTGRPRSLEVSQDEARELAYHFIRVKLANEARPVAFEQASLPGYEEPVWRVTLAGRKEGEPRGVLLIGVQTGATYAWQTHAPETALESAVIA